MFFNYLMGGGKLVGNYLEVVFLVVVVMFVVVFLIVVCVLLVVFLEVDMNSLKEFV